MSDAGMVPRQTKQEITMSKFDGVSKRDQHSRELTDKELDAVNGGSSETVPVGTPDDVVPGHTTYKLC